MMAIQQDGSQKLEARLKRCVLNGFRRRPIMRDQELMVNGPDGLPIDLSKRSSKMANVVYIDGAEVTLTDEEVENPYGNVDDDRGDDDDGQDEDEEVEVSDEPLNLSTNGNSVGGGKISNCPRVKSVPTPSKTTSPDLLQKRVRLEEMVSYIRKCSVVDGGKYCLNNSVYPRRSSDASDADSEGDDEEKPIKRSLSCSGLSNGEDALNHTNTVHRRKRSVPFRGGGVIRVTYRNNSNGDSVHQPRTYPVLRQQLLRSVSREEEEADELIESDVNSDVENDEELQENDDVTSLCQRSSTVAHENSSNSDPGPIVPPPPHWSAYAYYANLFQELQSSLPAAAQGLLMTTTVSASHDVIAKNDAMQQQQQVSDGRNSSANGTPANALLRKRAPRALTGKHVKHGTGASPATLLTLRQKIEQKMNQQQPTTKTASKCGNANRHQENGSGSNKDSRRGVSKKANKRKGTS